MTEGVRALLASTRDLLFQLSFNSLEQAGDLLKAEGTDVLLLDQTFGNRAILELVSERSQHSTLGRTAIVVWGAHLSDAEAARFLQAGVRGVLLRNAEPPTLVSCLRSIAAGNTWVQTNKTLGDGVGDDVRTTAALTLREQQVRDLAVRGLTNKEIGVNLGITTGTVKVHMKQVLGKTGATGRHGLILSKLRRSDLPAGNRQGPSARWL